MAVPLRRAPDHVRLVAGSPWQLSPHRQRACEARCDEPDDDPLGSEARRMNAAPSPSVDGRPWQRQLFTALGCAAVGVLVRFATFIPVQLATVGLAIGVIGAAFLLGWAADAGEAVFHGGLVLAAVALATVLPELIIEVRFAFTQQSELVTANLTGATRLLLVGAITMPLAVAYVAYRRREPPVAIRLAAA